MEKTIAEITKGEVVLDVKLVTGKLVITTKYDGKGANAGVYLELEADYFLDKLAAAIPGQMDDAVIAMIKGLLKK